MYTNVTHSNSTASTPHSANLACHLQPRNCSSAILASMSNKELEEEDGASGKGPGE